MSDTPKTFGEALYGPSGPSTGPQGPTPGTVESGIAAPATAPTPATPAVVATPSAPKAQPTEPTTEAPAPSEPSEPTEAEAAMLTEFTSVADTMGLGEHERSELMQLHTRAMQGMYDQHARTSTDWRTQSEAQIPAHELADIRTRFNAALGNDRDAQEFRRLLAWSGVGNHPSTIRAVARLLKR